MYKQTLCVTLPISAAVIIAAALFANAGDINPPEGPIGPTMHTLDEIYELAAMQQPCPPCTWEHWFGSVTTTDVQAVSGPGVLHGLWIDRSPFGVEVRDRIVGEGGPTITILRVLRDAANSDESAPSEFFELNIPFDNGIALKRIDGENTNVTVLYRSTKP